MNIISKLTNPPPAPASGGHYAEASFAIAKRLSAVVAISIIPANDEIASVVTLPPKKLH
jgi:hypothetical protein